MMEKQAKKFFLEPADDRVHGVEKNQTQAGVSLRTARTDQGAG
jgi:hypothetical protein